ncbi:MAG: phosphatase PAP2 family protein [Pseudomonadaceae bacterium]|nr:phosphatase PAP2 family protein [Pseudomonadaceae bacterium]
MPTTTAALYSRPLKTWLCFGLPLGLILLLLIFPPTTLDFAISHLFYNQDQGFIGKHNFWLEDILHNRAKQAVYLLEALALVGFLASFINKAWAWLRLPLGYLVLAIGISYAVVTPLKVVTGVHCPWDLAEFGGKESYSPLLSSREPTTNPGKCWPAGHASGGFTLFALYFLFRDRRPRLAKAALVFALALGTLFSIGRIMQGAHFFSHNLWTALFDWMIALGFYHLLLYHPQAKGLTVEASEPAKIATSLE